jgi:hypothetical protein
MVVQPVRITTAERASTAFVIGSERSTRRRTSDDSENGRARRGEALGQLRIHHDLADELLKREIEKRLVAADALLQRAAVESRGIRAEILRSGADLPDRRRAARCR